MSGGVLASLLTPAPASAQDPGRFGVRAGISVNPDQFHAGAHVDSRGGSRLWFRPGFEFGVGNGVRLGALNGDVLVGWTAGRWRPYAGAGPGLDFIDVTSGVGEAQGVETELVLNVVAGVAWGGSGGASRRGRGRYFLEVRPGFGDTPDLKVTAGFSF